MPADYPGDDAGQEELAKWLAKRAEKAGLPPELPVMAALVESGVRNLNYGDADSVGFFQMRVGIWNKGEYAGYPKNPGLQANWFIDTALAHKRQRIAAGDADFGKDPREVGRVDRRHRAPGRAVPRPLPAAARRGAPAAPLNPAAGGAQSSPPPVEIGPSPPVEGGGDVLVGGGAVFVTGGAVLVTEGVVVVVGVTDVDGAVPVLVLEDSVGLGFFFFGSCSAGRPEPLSTAALTVASPTSITSAGCETLGGGLGLPATAPAGDAERGREGDDHDSGDDEELSGLHPVPTFPRPWRAVNRLSGMKLLTPGGPVPWHCSHNGGSIRRACSRCARARRARL